MPLKHTPGPWRFQGYAANQGFSIWAPTVGVVAERWAPTLDMETPFQANARLIAAAPELLQVLHLIVRSFEEVYPQYEGDQFWKMAQDVIAKAEGTDAAA